MNPSISPENQTPSVNSLELITRSQRVIYGYIFSLVGSRDQADEILQQTNLVLCRKIGEFDGRAKFTTWACRIAYFEVLAKRKKMTRENLTFMDDTLLDAVAGQAMEFAQQENNSLSLLRECMKDLPTRSRSMIEKRYAPGGTIKKIAEESGRSQVSIRVALHRIRTLLLQCIQRKTTAQA